MGICFSGLLPHPPIIVPAVGRGRGEECRQTTEACRIFARELLESAPERLVLISPHSPRRAESLGIWDGARLGGDLAAFGAPETHVDLPADIDLADGLREACRSQRLRSWWIPSQRLDHGAAVPLWFLQEAGWSGPTTILSLPALTHEGDVDLRLASRYGAALGEVASGSGRPCALVASGDMTHRALPGAPAGYERKAVEFDQVFEELVRRGRLDRLCKISPELRQLAAEDSTESAVVAAAAHHYRCRGQHVLSYEHPFGVGYLVSVFFQLGGPGGSTPDQVGDAHAQLPGLARLAVAAWCRGDSLELPAARGPLARRAAAFVTLRQRASGELRGCIGNLEPAFDDLQAEVVQCAIHAASRDPRFEPVSAGELDDLVFSVSILDPPEPAELHDLDPQSYGVIVRDALGRRGVLLPRVSGVESIERQVEIARDKAGIAPEAAVELERFRSIEVHESETPPSP